MAKSLDLPVVRPGQTFNSLQVTARELSPVSGPSLPALAASGRGAGDGSHTCILARSEALGRRERPAPCPVAGLLEPGAVDAGPGCTGIRNGRRPPRRSVRSKQRRPARGPLTRPGEA